MTTERIQEALGVAVERHLRLYFAAHEGRLPAAGLYDRIVREVERPLIIQALAACEGNQLQAARLLGLNRNTLRKKLQDLEINARIHRRGAKAIRALEKLEELADMPDTVDNSKASKAKVEGGRRAA